MRKKGRKDFDIQIHSVAEGKETPAVDHGANDRVFGWAPEGHEIFFASDRSGNIDLWRQRLAEGRPQGEPRLAKADLGDVSPRGIAAKLREDSGGQFEVVVDGNLVFSKLKQHRFPTAAEVLQAILAG